MWDLIVSVPDHCLLFYFPDALKLTKLLPMHKGGPPNDPSNNRLISILSTLSNS